MPKSEEQFAFVTLEGGRLHSGYQPYARGELHCAYP